MGKIVKIIAATKAEGSNKDLNEQSKKRVAAYARVSTDSDEQTNSFENQVSEWTRRIEENPDWELVKIYTDEGISGTSTKGREGFNEMIDDAKSGKIDLILVKSISRFARNMVLTMQTIRDLKSIGVDIYFDNEHLYASDPKNEFIFAILSMVAQEESHHISENVNWTIQKKMREGVPFITASNFLGYDLSEDGKELIINEEQAEIVRLIFDLYDAGEGVTQICKTLKDKGYKTMTGSSKWHTTTITGILRNEKYKGDLCLQKTYTVDYLSHKRKENTGQRQKYYIEGAHQPIISREQWDRVNYKLENSSNKYVGANRDLNKYNSKYALSGTLICLDCGNTYKRRKWSGSTRRNNKYVYQCNGYINKLEDGSRCASKPVSETLALKACCEVINNMYLKNSKVFNKISSILKTALDTERITIEINRKIKAKEKLNENINQILNERLLATTEELTDELNNKNYELIEKVNSLNVEIQRLKQREKNSINAKERLDQMLKILSKKELTPDMITKDILEVFIYRIIVVNNTDLVFVIDGTKTMPIEKFVEQRQSIAKLPPLFQSSITGKDPLKRATLNYKVVLI